MGQLGGRVKIVERTIDRARYRAIAFLTPVRCALIAGSLPFGIVFLTFSGNSASETTHGLNMIGAGSGMASGLLVAMILPVVVGLTVWWVVKRKRDACLARYGKPKK